MLIIWKKLPVSPESFHFQYLTIGNGDVEEEIYITVNDHHMCFTNPESTIFFHEISGILDFIFERVAKCFFFCYHQQLFLISILIPKQISCRKTKHRKFRRFVDSGMVKTCDEHDLIEGSPSFLIFVVPFLQWNDSWLSHCSRRQFQLA